jgi:outer membrane protein assembly factor BamB
MSITRMAAVLLASLALAAGSTLPAAEQAAGPGPDQARQILQATGVRGGLVIHLGCGDGKLTAALHANDSYLVQGLDADAANVDKAREHIRSLGLCGKVTADRWTGDRLPYIENLVNLLVAEDLGKVPMAEVVRVLAPLGVAYVKTGGQWAKTVKPRPKDIDEWTQYMHDSTNNAVAHDTEIGPPRHFQWLAGPRYSRHHDHMSAASAMVSAGGRVFYIFDHASPMSIELPSKWLLVARDAFNGTLLWQRPIETWYTEMIRLKSGPAQVTRRLVAAGDAVYVTLGLNAPVSTLDAATGKTIRTFAGTEHTEELIFSDGTLFLMVNDSPLPQPASPKEINYNFADGPRHVVAVEAASGNMLWNSRQPNIMPLTLAADAQRVYLYDGARVVSLERRSGRPLWTSAPLGHRSPIATAFAPTLVVYRDVVLFGGGDKSMAGLDAATGKTLWTGEHPPSGHHTAQDILVMDGLAWAGAIAQGSDSGIFIGRDPRTGEIKKQFPPDVQTYWFHHRCYRAKATDNFLLTSRTGIEFIDPKTGHWDCNHWVRGACLYGVMPANGMVYDPPHPCACYLEAKLYGFNALAPESPTRQVPAKVPADGRLERGPACDQPVAAAARPDDWPTYRCDAARSGHAKAPVPADLKSVWESDLGGRLSSVVIAEGKVFVASVDTHVVHALDAASGNLVWSYTAGGRVDSPPTVWEGRALFGSADGYVYCLRACDGALVWRFRAAPIDRRMEAYDQVESVWPVSGSVLIRGGELWCVAGRSLFLDGGMRLVRLDPKTGRLIGETVMDDRDPASGKNLQADLKGLNMPVALPDILSYDGKYAYMRSQRFDANGVRQEVGVPTEDVSAQRGEGAHLFCPTGFLDDLWWHRSYWVFGRVWKSGAGGYYQAGQVAPAGRPMVFDDTTVFGYGRKPQYYKWTTAMEYQLFACEKQPKIVSAAGPAGAVGVSAGMAAAKKSDNAAPPAAAKKKKGTMGQPPPKRVAFNWTQNMPVLVRAMVLAGGTLFLAGPPDLVDEEQALKEFGQEATQKQLARQAAALEGAEGMLLWAVSAADGKKLAELKLRSVPVFDGMAGAGDRLYMATADGKVICLGKSN